MIALINFTKDLVVERREAEKLKLVYTEHERFGKVWSYGKEIKPMSNSDKYIDELFFNKEDGKYYTDEEFTKNLGDYYIHDRIPEKDWVFVSKDNNLVELEHFALNCIFPYTIQKCVKTEEPTIQNVQHILNEMEEKFALINKSLEIFSNQQFNQKVNVHVGGGLIVTYNDLKLMEDTCTDQLQNELNDGWRIIAVCVQPDQRRPDYVLGRFNPEKDCRETSAKRK